MSSYRHSLPVFFFLLWFFPALLMPSLNQLTGYYTTSIPNQENRGKIPPPSIKNKDIKYLLKKFPRHMDAFYTRHFSFREELITAYSYIHFFLLHTAPNEKVIIGKNDWLFHTKNTTRRPLMDLPDTGLYQLFESHGIYLLGVRVPSKKNIYPEYLPEEYKKFSLIPPPHVDISTPHVNLYPVLLRAKESGLPLFYRYDHHWNAIGSYWGYKIIYDHLTKKFSDLPAPLTMDDFILHWKKTPEKSLALLMHLTDFFSEEVPHLFLKKNLCKKQVKRTPKYNDTLIKPTLAFNGRNDPIPIVEITNPCAPSDVTIVIAASSYFRNSHYGISRYLSYHVRKVIFIENTVLQHNSLWPYVNPARMIERYSPDIVIHQLHY